MLGCRPGIVQVAVSFGEKLVSAHVNRRRQWSWQRFAFAWRTAGIGTFTLTARPIDK
jgi:hypothetical protein